MSVPDIIYEITTQLATIHAYPKRLRIAVTPSEYETIRAHMLSRFGEFYGRILNVPIVVDPAADDPPLEVQYAE
jgi:hypothetical protein